MRTVGDTSTLTSQEKAWVLPAIIRAAIAVAPERVKWLTAEAETAARSIEDPFGRSRALEGVAVAAVDLERAEAPACSIEISVRRLIALANLVQSLAPAR